MFYPDSELQRISAKYFKTLCDLSTELAAIPAPRSNEVVVLHLPWHRLEFTPHEQKKCKECGK